MSTHLNAPLTPRARPVYSTARRARITSLPNDAERTAALAEFLNTYNYERTHSALGNKPPASRAPITTYRLPPQPKALDVPQIEGLAHEPTLFDLL